MLNALLLYRRPLADYLLARGASLGFSNAAHGTIFDLAEMEESPDWKGYLTLLATRARLQR